MMKIKKLLLAILNSRPDSQIIYYFVQLNKNELSAFVSGTDGIKKATWSQFFGRVSLVRKTEK